MSIDSMDSLMAKIERHYREGQISWRRVHIARLFGEIETLRAALAIKNERIKELEGQHANTGTGTTIQGN